MSNSSPTASADVSGSSSPTVKKKGTGAAVAVAMLMLFSMFFGAGNLIFPPILGASSGDGFSPAISGFLITGVALPVITVIAVAITGKDVQELAARGGKIFGLAFPVAVYLALGAAYALPRTAVVSYSSAVTPVTGFDGPVSSAMFAVIFFSIALALAFDPTGIVDRLGKYLTPALLVLLTVLIVLSVTGLKGEPPAASDDYADNPLAAGLIEGYMTMDSLAAMAFGIVVLNSLRQKGINYGPSLVRGVATSAIGAGVVLVAVYVGLGLVGQIFPGSENYTDGAALLSDAARSTMGFPGVILFGGIVLLACLTTAAGLIGATCEFFHKIIPSVSYRTWAVFFAAASVVVSTLGLDVVLSIAAPIIGFLYPIAITLVAITIIEPLLGRKLHWAFRISLTVVTVWAALMTAEDMGADVSPLIGWSPGHDLQLGWMIPTAVAIVVGIIVDFVVRPDRAVPIGGEQQIEAELRGSRADEEALNDAIHSAQEIFDADIDTVDIDQAIEESEQHVEALRRAEQEARERLVMIKTARKQARQSLTTLRNAKKRHVGEQLE
ncbi:branched-chain amino acid transporter [Corynebacterium falsenii DSM 44353]|nr:branched-chain amino acid transport system II carrier protein [Corynebacterium falsenii]AHI04148.1 branched-chain amino acid transporter [Corynebacterium falsenii DSM 44353]MDC7103958.1 branched-chain amino acid transport system II carrier protein [Corynebacterium falsenii]UBI04946.1 branched-chain amino acid transport system II carrier protein [Corynebacterium falsenii]